MTGRPPRSGWFCSSALLNLQNFGIDHNYVQRYLAPRSEPDARRGVWLDSLLHIPVRAVLRLIVTALHAWYYALLAELHARRTVVAAQQSAARRARVSMNSLDDDDLGDRAFPHFIATQLLAGLAGLIVAAILATGMSMISTSSNSSATLMQTDLYRRLLRRRAHDQSALRVVRIASLACGAEGTGAALRMINVRSALDAWWKLVSAFRGGIRGRFLLGLLCRRAGTRASAAAVLLGLIAIVWMVGSPAWPNSSVEWRSPLHLHLTDVVATFLILAGGLKFALLSVETLSQHHQELLYMTPERSLCSFGPRNNVPRFTGGHP